MRRRNTPVPMRQPPRVFGTRLDEAELCGRLADCDITLDH
jgi:hypothetical protein